MKCLEIKTIPHAHLAGHQEIGLTGHLQNGMAWLHGLPGGVFQLQLSKRTFKFFSELLNKKLLGTQKATKSVQG